MNKIRKPFILIVDSDSSMITLFRIILEMNGYEVVIAGNGEQAISVLRNTMPERPLDILMIDLKSPIMDGLHFMSCLRNELKKFLPVLVLSGMNKPVDVERVLHAGANGVLNKPVEPAIVINKLAELLRSTCAKGSIQP